MFNATSLRKKKELKARARLPEQIDATMRAHSYETTKNNKYRQSKTIDFQQTIEATFCQREQRNTKRATCGGARSIAVHVALGQPQYVTRGHARRTRNEPVRRNGRMRKDRPMKTTARKTEPFLSTARICTNQKQSFERGADAYADRR